jgi:cytoskeletal protein RodZ
MMNTFPNNEQESLGAFLRRTREEHGVTFEEMVDSTKISPNNLKALEEDDYNKLPADAFVRGFYGIYAKFFSLDPVEIRERYSQQRSNMARKSGLQSPAPIQSTNSTSSMAERPSIASHSLVGLTLLAIFIVVAAISWYMSWNPATYISQKLRGVEESPAVSTEPAKPAADAEAEPSITATTSPVAPEAAAPAQSASGIEGPDRGNMLVSESNAPIASRMPPGGTREIAVTPSDAPATQTSAAAVTDAYVLKASFTETTRLTVKIDDKAAEHLNFPAGASHSWNAGKSIVISLPSATSAMLTLNDLPLALPKKPAGQEITISIPEFLLQ